MLNTGTTPNTLGRTNFLKIAPGLLAATLTVAMGAALAAALAIALEVGLEKFAVPDYLLPRPSQVLLVFKTDAALLTSQTLFTLLEWALGLIVSLLVALPLAYITFRSVWAARVLHPFVVVSQSVPYLCFAPLLLIWLGIGMAPKVVLVVLTCAFPIALLTEQGLSAAREEYELVVAMLQMPPRKAFFEVYFPAALPSFFSGLRISATYAFVSAVIAELIGSEKGLGVYLLRAQNSYRTDRVVAGVVIIVVVSLVVTWCVDRARNKIVFWNKARR